MPRKHEAHASSYRGRNKDRYGNPDSFDRIGQQVDDDRHDCHPHETSAIKAVLYQEVEGEKGGTIAPPSLRAITVRGYSSTRGIT
jgi:hypothetical protein